MQRSIEHKRKFVALRQAECRHSHLHSSGLFPVHGQGTVAIKLKKYNEFCVKFRQETSDESLLSDSYEIEILWGTVRMWKYVHGIRSQLDLTYCDTEVGIDMDLNTAYWFSLDSAGKYIRYGKGEMRIGTELARSSIKADVPGDPLQSWVGHLKHIEVNQDVQSLIVFRDPVVIEPPVRIVPSDAMSMDDAATAAVTVPAGLNPACQQLYGNVSGEKFVLNTDDFPEFTEAVERSIKTPTMWCYEELRRKESEFGAPDPLGTYLRITLGQNMGNSPGVPYVMEIWPVGHYSPIHNHSDANAIIRVLHGTITVKLFSMLSFAHDTPFAITEFTEGEVTYLSPDLNQTHQLVNNDKSRSCITIQCYQYDGTDKQHYEYFDYLDTANKVVGHFYPASDMDFVEFKKTMKKEWDDHKKSTRKRKH